MPLYESVFIARQDISGPQAESLADDFSKIIEDNGGKVVKRENWGLRSLAYRIKKNRKGHYILFNLDAPADAIKEMERQMRIHEDILRYLSLRLDELEEGPSVIMQRAAPREERPRRDYGDRNSRPAAPKSAKPESAKTESAKTESAKPESAKTEPAAVSDKSPADKKEADDGAKSAKSAESAESAKPAKSEGEAQ